MLCRLLVDSWPARVISYTKLSMSTRSAQRFGRACTTRASSTLKIFPRRFEKCRTIGQDWVGWLGQWATVCDWPTIWITPRSSVYWMIEGSRPWSTHPSSKSGGGCMATTHPLRLDSTTTCCNRRMGGRAPVPCWIWRWASWAFNGRGLAAVGCSTGLLLTLWDFILPYFISILYASEQEAITASNKQVNSQIVWTCRMGCKPCTGLIISLNRWFHLILFVFLTEVRPYGWAVNQCIRYVMQTCVLTRSVF